MNTSELRRLRAGERLGHLFPRQRLSGLPGPGPLVGSEPKGTRGGEGDRAAPRDAWVIQMAVSGTGAEAQAELPRLRL